jgi:uncharacterized membrane-anchored protein
VSTPTVRSHDGTTNARTFEDERDYGWLVFAGITLLVAGVFSVFDGILAVSESSFYVADARFVFSDLNTWGWIVLVIGCLAVVAGFAVMARHQFARWFGIAAASINAAGQLMFVQAYPWWALSIFALDVLIIYALAVHGGRLTAAR